MYEMKDWEDAGQMLTYLNGLPTHEVVTLVLDPNGWWRSVVKVERDEPKRRKVRPKGWKPGDPYVEMEA
jgi:hypothetical protein